MPAVAPIFSTIATVLRSVAAIFAAVADVLVPIAPSAEVPRIAHILPKIPAIFTTVANVFPSVPPVLYAVARPLATLGCQGRRRGGKQHQSKSEARYKANH